jgi:flavin-dependent dehydrogenase
VLLSDPRIGAPPCFKVGESLPAVAKVALRDLGIAPGLVEASGARRSTGILSAWGSDEPLSREALLDPHGHGLHLDRQRFEALLLEQAKLAGAQIRAEKLSVQTNGAGASPGAVHLRIGTSPIDARWVVDATGRAAVIARRLGARPARSDRLVAVHATVRTAPADVDARTRVEATSTGWWYSALVASRRRVVAFLTDADLLNPVLRSRTGFAAALALTGHELPRGAAFEVESRPATTVAHGSRLRPAHGPGWITAGDAALAFDPLSSQGILNALVSGMLAAGAAVEALAGEQDAPAAYERRLADIWAVYEARRADAYGLEQRWPAEPFWARRTVRKVPPRWMTLRSSSSSSSALSPEKG